MAVGAIEPKFYQNFIEGLLLLNCFLHLKFVTHVSHFTGVCLDTWPMTESKAGVDFALIQTSCVNAN